MLYELLKWEVVRFSMQNRFGIFPFFKADASGFEFTWSIRKRSTLNLLLILAWKGVSNFSYPMLRLRSDYYCV